MDNRPADPWTYTTEKERQNQIPLNSSDDLDSLLEKIGDSKFVLLGEASHGTHEFYTWRTAISKRLIEEKGFNFIAVEGDWPDCYKMNRFIKGYSDAGIKTIDVLKNFERWPSWMWANWEVAALMEWLKEHNSHKHQKDKVGFYGLDVYSLWESLNELIRYLEKTDKQAAQLAKAAFTCFEPYNQDGQDYARSVSSWIDSCRDEVIDLLKKIRSKAQSYNHDPEASLNTEQNAFVAVEAEHYYRSMVTFGEESWNVRDRHMADTLNRLIKFHGAESKVIVWEHNTHIGDARATNMIYNNMLNVGQIVREEHESDGVFIIGFGSYKGTVIAGSEWGAPMQIMPVPPAKPGSIEEILHSEGAEDKIILFDPEDPKERFLKQYPHRAIGVVYHPEYEKQGNYVPSIMAKRYDAFIYLDETTALNPIYIKTDKQQVPDTYPFGL